MSKKDRLKAQAEKQIQARREQEEQEREEREAARHKQSRSAKKMMKKAKHGRYGKEPIGFMILKLLMLVPFAYSGLYYGLIMISGTLLGYIEPQPPEWVLWFMLIGELLVLAGIVVEFFKKHIPSFVAIAVGTGLFVRASKYFVDYIRARFEEVYVTASLEGMDTDYIKHLYPMIAVAAISLIILIWWIVLKILAARRKKRLRDTAPVRSIVDD